MKLPILAGFAFTTLAALGGAAGYVGGIGAKAAGGVGSRVFVVERSSETLAVYDLDARKVVERIPGLGNLQHATMTFSRDLRWGYVATRSGRLTRIDLERLERAGEVQTSKSSIDIAVSQDGRFIATAEYAPGGVTILDAKTLEVKKRIPAVVERDGQRVESRATGVVDAAGNRFACVLIEGRRIWVIDASKPDLPIELDLPTEGGEPYDAMITPDGLTYVVGHLGSDDVSVLDLDAPERGVRTVSLLEPSEEAALRSVTKLPHMASWAVAQGKVFVPLVGQKRLAVLDRETFRFERTVHLRGNPVYAVKAPGERELWVSFSGEEDDAFVEVIDTKTLESRASFRVGRRIYHMDFTPRGSHALVTANQDDKLVLIDAATRAVVDEEPLRSPSGVFGPWRAFVTGL